MVGIIIIVLTIWLIFVFRPENWIGVEKLKKEPNNFLNMTEEQMQNFPHLKEAILTNKSVDVNSYQTEVSKLEGILEYFDTRNICYRDEYYEIYHSVS